MNKHQEETCKRVREASEEIQDVLALTDWRVRWEWQPSPMGSEEGDDMEASTASCVTKALWKYRDVTFHCYLQALGTASDEGLFFLMLHEWVHVLTSGWFPYFKSGSHVEDMIERITEDLTRALMAALGRDLPED